MGHAKLLLVSRGAFMAENCCIFMEVSLKFALKELIDNSTALAQIMTRHHTGNKPLFKAMMAYFTDAYKHLPISQPQWLMPQWLSHPDSKVHGANMGPTWLLSAPDGPHVGPMNLAIRANTCETTQTNTDTVECCYNVVQFNTLRPRQDGRHFPDDIFKCIFLNENV